MGTRGRGPKAVMGWHPVPLVWRCRESPEEGRLSQVGADETGRLGQRLVPKPSHGGEEDMAYGANMLPSPTSLVSRQDEKSAPGVVPGAAVPS